MSLHSDMKETLSSWTDEFTNDDVIKAFSNKKPASVKATVSKLVSEGMIVKTSPIETSGRGRKSYNMKWNGVEETQPKTNPVNFDDDDVLQIERLSFDEEREIARSIVNCEYLGAEDDFDYSMVMK
jgi:hypothetical protein